MSAQSSPAPNPAAKPITLPRLLQMHAEQQKIAVLTCYDASFAALLDACEVDCVLVGDSLGMVIQGERTTLPVTVEQVAYHTRCVARALNRAWLIADMPFGSYQSSMTAAYDNAARLMQAGAQMVKLEGGAWLAPTVEMLAARGIPVCAHLGLTPQSVFALGGYRVQAKTEAEADRLLDDARALQVAGATMLVLEMVPAALAAAVTRSLAIPTIGIGAGADCSGQVLVLHDMLDVFPGRKPRFVRNFMDGAGSIRAAIAAYVAAVRSGGFPGPEHGY